jgi:hypothetical protein
MPAQNVELTIFWTDPTGLFQVIATNRPYWLHGVDADVENAEGSNGRIIFASV